MNKKTEFRQTLEEIVREGARKMLQQAVENEIEEFVKQFCDVKDKQGHERSNFQRRRRGRSCGLKVKRK